MPSEEFERLRGTLKISSAVRKADGVHLRIVGEAPQLSTIPAEPELEEAFLFLMNSEAAAP